ncbi:MAG: hypothetical protein IV100_09110 [Myxococcales bacterium]|nr:hypothetical protein [Myxococcales bacterium]
MLCNGRCAAFSLFAPFDSRNFGAAVGKRRFLFYGMCHAHQANEHAQACEDKLSRDLATSTIGTRPGDAVQ